MKRKNYHGRIIIKISVIFSPTNGKCCKSTITTPDLPPPKTKHLKLPQSQTQSTNNNKTLKKMPLMPYNLLQTHPNDHP